jgi:ATP adenylyltransferase
MQDSQIFSISELAFKHACLRIPAPQSPYPVDDAWAYKLEELYKSLFHHLGLGKLNPNGELPSYNFIMTKDWMFMVPRSHENCGRLSLNSVAFAGTLLVKTGEDMNFVKMKGHMEIFKSVTFAK